MILKGYLGQVELHDDVVVVKKKLQAETVIPLGQIRNISIVSAGIGMSAIHFDTSGNGVGDGSHRKLATNAFALTFKSKRRPEFEQFWAAVSHAAGVAPPMPDQSQKLPSEVERQPAVEPASKVEPVPGKHARRGASPSIVVAWSPQTALSAEVAGESYHGKELKAVFQGHRTDRPEGVELQTTAVLVPDPENAFDSNAVEVHIKGQLVGFLSREDAAEYSRTLQSLADDQCVLEVPARAWARTDGDWIGARVTLSLAPLDGIRPSNSLPVADFEVLPAGSVIQVTKEDEHMEALERHVHSVPSTWVAATLHRVDELRARSSVEVIEVRIDGEPVGVLTPGQSRHLLPLVKHLNELGKIAVARAVVTGNALKAEVMLYACKAHEAPRDWLDALGPLPGSWSDSRPKQESAADGLGEGLA